MQPIAADKHCLRCCTSEHDAVMTQQAVSPEALVSRWAPKLLLVLEGEVPIKPLGGLLPSSHPTEFPGGLLPCSAPAFLHRQPGCQNSRLQMLERVTVLSTPPPLHVELFMLDQLLSIVRCDAACWTTRLSLPVPLSTKHRLIAAKFAASISPNWWDVCSVRLVIL